MKTQAYQLYIPIEIDDIIKAVDDETRYKVIDILHTYSAGKQTIVNVDLVLCDTMTGNETILPFKNNYWEVINNE